VKVKYILKEKDYFFLELYNIKENIFFKKKIRLFIKRILLTNLAFILISIWFKNYYFLVFIVVLFISTLIHSKWNWKRKSHQILLKKIRMQNLPIESQFTIEFRNDFFEIRQNDKILKQDYDSLDKIILLKDYILFSFNREIKIIIPKSEIPEIKVFISFINDFFKKKNIEVRTEEFWNIKIDSLLINC